MTEMPKGLVEDGPGIEGLQAEDATAADGKSRDTRDRLLDVALDLFIEQGYDKTSLREIAEHLGITKAALYYYFESKEDILMALHMRLHEFGRDGLIRLTDEVPTRELWAELLDQLVDQILDNRKIFLLHERNQAALETLHRKDHDAEHEDLQNRFRLVLSDQRVPIEDRVRMAASFGAMMSGVFFAGEAFDEVSAEDLGRMLRSAMHDLLGA